MNIHTYIYMSSSWRGAVPAPGPIGLQDTCVRHMCPLQLLEIFSFVVTAPNKATMSTTYFGKSVASAKAG